MLAWKNIDYSVVKEIWLSFHITADRTLGTGVSILACHFPLPKILKTERERGRDGQPTLMLKLNQQCLQPSFWYKLSFAALSMHDRWVLGNATKSIFELIKEHRLQHCQRELAATPLISKQSKDWYKNCLTTFVHITFQES